MVDPMRNAGQLASTADLLRHAIALHQAGQLAQALALYGEILRREPRHVDALHLSGVIAAQSGQPARAAELIGRALVIDPNHAAAQINQGLALRQLGQLSAALARFEQALAVNPQLAEACYHRGMIYLDLGQPEAALREFERTLAIRPDLAEAHCCRGLAHRALGQLPEALRSLERAISIRPDFAEAFCNRGLVLKELGDSHAALASYERAITLQSNFAEAFHNRALVLKELRRRSEALADYDRAIALKPDYAEAYADRGNLLKDLKRFDEALASYDRAIALQPDFAEVYANRGNLLRDLMRYEAAVESYDAALTRGARSNYVRSMRLYARLHLCDWRNWDGEVAELIAGVEADRAVVHPFLVLALTDSAALQRKAARIWTREECPADSSLPALGIRPRGEKIRVGYFSADFREHAVARLTAGLFEAHDRARFELTALSFGPDDGGPMRRRLERAFDRFIDVREQSDRDVALLARRLELDIAVDLGGFTAEARPGIFALRAAPLQVSYLGYLGTLGAAYMDYLVADRTIVPASHQDHYAERILYLPSYQANDARRLTAQQVLSRQELGLPPGGAVLCCFNANYKLNPGIFDRWMRILRRAPDSVLYLYAGSTAVEANLRKEAGARDIDPARLFFGGKLPYEQYLARYRVADLFLDTLPYNAGTTASDALWAGLPVLTCAGNAFAGRVGASLLQAIGLPELITSSGEQYEDVAVELARDPARLEELKRRLEVQGRRASLFDTTAFTRALEQAYIGIHERHQLGLPPEHTVVV